MCRLSDLKARFAFGHLFCLVALVAIALGAIPARADNIVLNQGGAINVTGTTWKLGSGVVSVTTGGVNYSDGGVNIGNLSLTVTGFSGSFATSGTFTGGTISITSNANGVSLGLPATLFSGTFVGPVTWQLQGSGAGGYTYVLSGEIMGTFYNGSTLSGGTTQITINMKHPFNGHSASLAGGTTTLAETPEPGSFGLLGAGLISAAGMVKRRVIGSWLWRTAQQSAGLMPG